MKTSVSLRSQIKKKARPEMTISSFKIEKTLHSKLMARLKREGLSLHSLIVAAANQFLAEK